MSADLLRRAASLMRERGEAATPGPWEFESHEDGSSWRFVPYVLGGHFLNEDAEHIASWHPAVALAVADWLEVTAAEHESDSGNPMVDNFFAAFDTAPDVAAIAVARAYLGESA